MKKVWLTRAEDEVIAWASDERAMNCRIHIDSIKCDWGVRGMGGESNRSPLQSQLACGNHGRQASYLRVGGGGPETDCYRHHVMVVLTPLIIACMTCFAAHAALLLEHTIPIGVADERPTF